MFEVRQATSLHKSLQRWNNVVEQMSPHTVVEGPLVQQSHLVLDPAFTIGAVDRRIFGSFVEHMGRCVYTGIHEPTHPTADEHGFRGDVAALTREAGVSLVRYPGGNFVSGYRWEDGVGPVEDRPARIDLAWRTLEPNTVGLNEFAGWARRAGVEPMLVVNLGTRGVQEACDLLEYTNHPGGTALSDLRVRHGHPEPHDVRLWGLGNEMDAPWQVGYATPEAYGLRATQTARAMRFMPVDLRGFAMLRSFIGHSPTMWCLASRRPNCARRPQNIWHIGCLAFAFLALWDVRSRLAHE